MDRAEQRTTYLLLAALMVPFGIAAYQDITSPKKRSGGAGLMAYELELEAAELDYDEYEAYEDYDDDDYYGELAELELDEDEEDEEELNSVFFGELFLDSANGPGLVGELRDLTPGASETHIRSKYRDLESWEYDGVDYFTRNYGIEVLVEPHFHDNTLTRVELSIEGGGDATELFTETWGAPTRRSEDSDVVEWFTPAKSLRLSYEHVIGDSYIVLERYQTFEELIAPKSKLFSFEKKDLLALSKREVRALPEYNGWSATLELPSIQGASSTNALAIYIEDDVVTRASLELELDAAGKKRALRLLEEKFGKGQIDDSGSVDVYLYKQRKRHIQWACDDYEGDYCQLVIAGSWTP